MKPWDILFHIEEKTPQEGYHFSYTETPLPFKHRSYWDQDISTFIVYCKLIETFIFFKG